MKTVGNNVMIKLDPENNKIKLNSGGELYLDTSFEPEKHTVVLGEVLLAPEKLKFFKTQKAGMPWETSVEIKPGDRVIMYYLAVQNALSKEINKNLKIDGETYIFTAYSNLYAKIENEKIIPINGYVLVEPIPNKKESILEVITYAQSKKDVVYGRVLHVGQPNKEYIQDDLSDNGVNVKPGDEIIMKKVRDIPMEYEYHTKLNSGKKMFRIQRHDILAVL